MRSSAKVLASSKFSPCRMISAPNARVCSTFTCGVKRGMTITAGMFSRVAWQATPCAWLPADTAITPAARCAAVRESSFANAPRSLNDAVNWLFSNFRKTWAPAMPESVRECRQGVATTAPEIAAPALRTSWKETGILGRIEAVAGNCNRGICRGQQKTRRSGFSILSRSSSGVLDVRRLLALRAGGDFEADLLAFLEGLEALHVDRREVREQIVAAVIRSDEAVALRVVEPLDGTSCHDVSLEKVCKTGYTRCWS